MMLWPTFVKRSFPVLCLGALACTGTARSHFDEEVGEPIGGGGVSGSAARVEVDAGAAAGTGAEAGSGSAAGGGSSSSGGGAGSGGAGGTGSAGAAGVAARPGWLSVRGNKIVTSDGRPFRGRGANLHDTRSCNACTYQAPNPAGLMRWADELVDGWNANFVRFLLWSWPSAEGRVHWQSLLHDEQYYRDIQTVVNHITSKNTYVMITLFKDPTQIESGERSEWPTEATLPVYRKLAEAFHANPRVLFALMNEPKAGAAANPELASIFNKSIDAIRSVERAHGSPQHIIVAQASQHWARDLSYWVEHPLTAGGGTNIAYEVHSYYPQSWFEQWLLQPARTLPVIIGEFGPFNDPPMSEADGQALMRVAEDNDIPYTAWNFHQRCEPNLIQDTGTSAYDGCGFSGAGSTFSWQLTSWGRVVKNQLAQPWGQ